MTEKTRESIYSTLSQIDVKPLLEKKGGLDYLSWAKAWGLVKSIYPDVTYKITEYPEYLPMQDGWQATGRTIDYRLTPAGCEVEVTVTIESHDFSSKLYVMDYKNRPIKNPTYFEINKTQMRCLVKALAFAGLGLNVYAGEDLPSNKEETPKNKKTTPKLPKLTDEQLATYSVDYHGKQRKLAQIVLDARQGDKEAAIWWKTQLKHADTEVGNAVTQFGLYAKRAKEQAKQGA